ncbi:hypothetical protein [Microlunatus sp. Y2014]|uniref:hypothetical protein n=1 Tax=Microlunatus sp. Y2014 TaxID=3418488 RepID=UPI003DA6DDAB
MTFEPPQIPAPPTPGGSDRSPSVSEADRAATGGVDVVAIRDKPRTPIARRLLLTLTGVLVVVAVIVAALAWGPGSPFVNPPPGQTPGNSASTSEEVDLTLPEQFSTFTRQTQTSPPPSPSGGDDLATATAIYTQNGEPSILLIVAGPVTDMEAFLLSLGAVDILTVNDGWCATYEDVPLCGVMQGNTAVAVSPIAGQQEETLVRLAKEAVAAR